MTFRFHRPGDEPRIVDLFQRVFGRSETAAWWRWKMLGRPGEIERVILAEEDGELVFHVGGIPGPAVLGGQPSTFVVAVDAMTRPGYRRRGLLTEGYRRLFDHWRAQGVDLVLGLPNEMAGLRNAPHGWRPLFPLQWRVRLLRPERVVARRLGLRRLARVTFPGRAWNGWWDRGRTPPGDLALEEGVPAAGELDALWARCRGSVHHGVVRDAAWFRWRYLDTPGSPYRMLGARRDGRLEGLLCWRVRDEEGRKTAIVAEILVPPDRAVVEEALLRRLTAQCHREELELVAALALEGSPRAALLGRNGFLRSWGAFQVACVPLRNGLEVDALRDGSGWSLDAGVFDVV